MNQKELKELIEFLIEKDIAEFELERGDVKIKIKRGGQHTVVQTRAEVPYVAVTVPQPGVPAVVVPSAAPVFSSRLSPRSAPMVRRVYGRTASLSRRELRRTSRAAIRTRDRLLDQKMSICRGC